MCRLLKTCLAIGAVFSMMPSAALAAKTRVAVIPFQINADKDYTFLQKGIVDMLSSRLSSPTVEVIDPLTTDKVLEEVKNFKGESKVLMAGAKLKADFAIYGSITILGGSVSIDARMVDITGTRAPLTFYKQTQGMEAVIPQINRLATEINTSVFGRTTAVTAQSPAVRPAPAAQPAPAAPSGDIHMNPEKMIQNGHVVSDMGAPAVGGAPQGESASTLNPAFVVPAGRSSATDAFWKSRNYQKLFNAMDVGDVNHDGRLETVVATPETLMIFQDLNGQFRLLKEIDTGRYAVNMGVDIADINGNGTPEIFVTAFNSQRNALSSKVLEFDGQTYKTLDEGKWYYRVVHHFAEGDKLLGQRQKAGSYTPFSSPIQELGWNGVEYLAKRQVLVGGKANLLGATVGDVMNDGSEVIVAFNHDDHLRILQPNGKAEWTDPEYAGGSPLYYALPASSPGDTHEPFFMPVRVRMADLNNDGKYQVIVARNKDTADRKMTNQRFYKESEIEALQWNGLGLVTAWQTGKISGRIQDLCIADFDNDGANELVAAVVTAEGALIGTKPKSTIIAYDLNQAQK